MNERQRVSGTHLLTPAPAYPVAYRAFPEAVAA